MIFPPLIALLKVTFEQGDLLITTDMALESIDSEAVYKEKYRNLKRKLKFLIYVSDGLPLS